METVILACLTALVLICMFGAGWMIWMLFVALKDAREAHERLVAQFTEALQELATKVKAATLEEATRYNALMHHARAERPPRRTQNFPVDLTPEMAESLSKHPEFQQMMMASEEG